MADNIAVIIEHLSQEIMAQASRHYSEYCQPQFDADRSDESKAESLSIIYMCRNIRTQLEDALTFGAPDKAQAEHAEEWRKAVK